MTLTLGNYIFLIIFSIIILLIGVFITAEIADDFKEAIMPVVITFLIILVFNLGCVMFMNWYNTKTASGIRNYKDWTSELSNGINREITITAEDGREIFYYEGKVDIESNHDDNYIKFEGEDGKRYIIYYGIQDTIKIIEK